MYISKAFFNIVNAVYLLQVKSNDNYDDSSDVLQLFRRVAGSDMEIDWLELQNVLNSSFQRGE